MLRMFNRHREDQPWLPWNQQVIDGETVRTLQDVERDARRAYKSTMFAVHYGAVRPVVERMSQQLNRRSSQEIMAAFDRLREQVIGTTTKERTKSLVQLSFPFYEGDTKDV